MQDVLQAVLGELRSGRTVALATVVRASGSTPRADGAKMMIAPDAETDDGLIEHVRMGPIGRLTLLRYFPKLFDGTYVDTPHATRRPVRRAEFELEGPVDVMIDGEVKRLHCETLDILPGALDVMA